MDFFDCTSPEIKERLIIENDLAFAFPTNIPIVPGHTLICPKRRVSKASGLTGEERDALLDLMGKLRPALAKAFGAEGFNFAWNEGEAAGQNILHFHLHMLPRKKGDSGVTEYEPRKFLYRPGPRPVSPQQELIEVARAIKEKL